VFKAGLKDLEIKICNVLTAAFSTISRVEVGVEILAVFVHMSSRELVRRTLDKKCGQLWGIFTEELNAVKKEFDAHRYLTCSLCELNKLVGPTHPYTPCSRSWQVQRFGPGACRSESKPLSLSCSSRTF
jgi:hypothetical protein